MVQRSRRSPARVQGENFVARDDQAGVWNSQVSVWKRPDGRTVSVDQNGNAIVSGRRGTQHVSIHNPKINRTPFLMLFFSTL